MAFSKLTAAQLEAAPDSGLINEDVMQTIMQIDKEVDLELTERISKGSHDNKFTEWTLDITKAADSSIALQDGADITGDSSGLGLRVGNHTQTVGDRVVVSYEAEAGDNIGRGSEIGYQSAMTATYLERSRNQALYLNQGSVKSTDGVAGLAAGLEAQITAEDLIRGTITTDASWTTTKLGTADSVVQQVMSAGTITGGGFNNYGATSAGLIDPWVYQAGVFEPGALTEASIRNVCQAIWKNTGRKGMTLVGLNDGATNRLWSAYAFSSTARIATMVSDKGDGATDARSAQGATNIFITDFGIVEFVPEKEMPVASTAGTADSQTLFLLDPTKVELSNIWNWRSERQGKTGLADKWQISEAHTLKLLMPGAVGMVQGIDTSLAMTA
jgi:hypothetical protein